LILQGHVIEAHDADPPTIEAGPGPRSVNRHTASPSVTVARWTRQEGRVRRAGTTVPALLRIVHRC
jgi:hypothetical protein